MTVCLAVFWLSFRTLLCYAKEVLTRGLHPSSWEEARADGNLWSLIASKIVSQSKDSIRVLKVKAHTSLEDTVSSFHQWLRAGKAAADRLAKSALASFVTKSNAENRALHETTKIDDAFACSKLLHQISLHVRDTSRESPEQGNHQNAPDGRPTGNISLGEVQPWQFDTTARFNSPIWGEKWLQLIQHYFSLFRWPSLEQRNPTPISLVEIMLHFCLTFQFRVPVNLQVTKLSGHGVPVPAPKDPAKYDLQPAHHEDQNGSSSRMPEADIAHFPADLRLPAKSPAPGPGRTGKSEITFPRCVLECTPIISNLTSTPMWPVRSEASCTHLDSWNPCP